VLLTATVAAISAAVGCASPSSKFEIVDYREPGGPKRYAELFDEAYYNLDDDGNVEIVLRRIGPPEVNLGQGITQVIRLHTFWRSIPGNTVATQSQINATVRYHLVAGRTGVTFEGAGSLFFNVNPTEGTLTGSLDRAVLHPRHRLTSGDGLFQRAELSGEFHATHDPRRVRRITNEMDRLFTAVPSRSR
jgi:hypothetical protein